MFGWKRTFGWYTRMDDIRIRIYTYIHTYTRVYMEIPSPVWASGSEESMAMVAKRHTSLWHKSSHKSTVTSLFLLSISRARTHCALCVSPRHRNSNGGLCFSASFGFIDADAVPAHCGLGRGLCPRALAPARPLQGLLQSLCLFAPCIRLALFLLQVRPELVAAPEQRWRPFHPCAGQFPPRPAPPRGGSTLLSRSFIEQCYLLMRWNWSNDFCRLAIGRIIWIFLWALVTDNYYESSMQSRAESYRLFPVNCPSTLANIGET